MTRHTSPAAPLRREPEVLVPTYRATPKRGAERHTGRMTPLPPYRHRALAMFGALIAAAVLTLNPRAEAMPLPEVVHDRRFGWALPARRCFVGGGGLFGARECGSVVGNGPAGAAARVNAHPVGWPVAARHPGSDPRRPFRDRRQPATHGRQGGWGPHRSNMLWQAVQGWAVRGVAVRPAIHPIPHRRGGAGMNDPMTELVCNAMGYGVMMALEGRDELLRKLQAQPSNGSLADALRSNAEAFIKTRADLTEALSVQIDTRPRVGQGGGVRGPWAESVHDHCYGGEDQ